MCVCDPICIFAEYTKTERESGHLGAGESAIARSMKLLRATNLIKKTLLLIWN